MPAESQDRLQLFNRLAALPSDRFEALLFALAIPAGIVGGPRAPQGNRAKDVLDWAEGPTGSGLEKLQVALTKAVAGKLDETQIDFEPYLRSILADEEYREWDEVYTPTTAEGRKQEPKPQFSRRLKLRVETVKPDKEPGSDGEKGTQERAQIEQFDVLAGLRNYAAEHVLLIGKPGSGKSTSLERLLWEEADRALHKSETKIPILAKLRRCTSTIENLIQGFLSRHELPLAVADIEALLQQGKLLLLLDGLNELPDSFGTVAANFRDRYRNIPMIFSTRDLAVGGTLGITKTLKMLPLTEPQMQEFVRGYLGEAGDKLFKQLKGDRLRKFAETPLLLWMLCWVFVQNGQVPANLGLAFREFTQLYDTKIQEDAPANTKGQWSKLLRHLAFALMRGKELVEFRLSMPREEAENLLIDCLQKEGRSNAREQAEQGLQDLLTYHLLQPVKQANLEEHIEFRHQLIQEYYAAEYLLRLLTELNDEQLKRDYLNLLKWTEPIALMLALLDAGGQALRVVKLATNKVDLMLGARLAGEVKALFQRKAVGLINDFQMPPRLKIQCLKVISNEATASELLKLIKNQDENVRDMSCYLLGKIKSIKSIQSLLNATEDQSLHVRSSARSSLCKIDSEEVIKILLKGIRDPKHNVRRIAARMLGYVGSEEVIPVLLKALRDLEPDVRCLAAEALGRIGNGNEGAISGLLQLAEDLEPEVRWRAAEALGRIGNEMAIPALLNIMKEQNPDLRYRAAWALGKVGDDTVISALECSCNDSSLLVRMHAEDSLRTIIDGEKTVPLMPYSLEEEKEFSVGVGLKNDVWSWYFGKPKNIDYADGEGAIPRLLNSVQDLDQGVRRGAAEALGKIGSPVPIADLWQLHLRKPEDYLERAIYTIQTVCKFYNYEVFQGITSPGESISLYLSYTPADEALKKQLANHLNLLERQGIITSWSQRQILPGDEPAQVINQELNAADVILLLISANSLANDTCYEFEIQRAMELYNAGESYVIPILLRPVDWAGAPFSQLPALPKNLQPVTLWDNQDQAFREIAEGIRAVVMEIRNDKGAEIQAGG